MKKYSVAVVGAMGAVGSEMLKILEQRAFPVDRIKPLDVGDNVGKQITFNGVPVTVEESKPGAFGDVDFALLAVDSKVSEFLAPIASKEGAIVINSGKSPAQLRPLLKGYAGRVFTIDAGRISEEELGKNFPNTPMLAAIVKVSGVVEPDAFVKDMEASFHHKFTSKPQVIEGNMRALKRSMEEVQAG